MVSADAIIQADATLIIGMIFLVTLRQAIGLRVTASFFERMWYPMGCFCASAGAALVEGEGLPVYEGHDLWWIIARVGFLLGIALIIFIMYRLAGEAQRVDELYIDTRRERAHDTGAGEKS